MDKGLNLEGATWKTSTKSGGNSDMCVEVALVDGGYGIRDSKNPAGAALSFTDGEWAAFKAGVVDGEFDK